MFVTPKSDYIYCIMSTYGHIQSDWNHWCVRGPLPTPPKRSEKRGATKRKGASHVLSISGV